MRLGILLALAAGLVALPAAGLGYVEAPVPDGGVVSGRVVFAGDVPRLAPLAVRKNTDLCGEEKPDEALVVGPGKGVRHAVVYLEGVERGKAPGELTIDNAKCQFVPHVGAVALGGKVRIRNADAVLHNTHGFHDRQTVFNIALPVKDQVVDITARIKKPGVIEVLCDAHTHMRAWIVVRDNPYHAVTDAEGRFRLSDVPPGRYRLVAWHEGWGVTGKDKDGRLMPDAPRVLVQEVTVAPRGEATVEFQLR